MGWMGGWHKWRCQMPCGAVITRSILTQILTKDTPYFTLTGELWGVFCEYNLWCIPCLSHMQNHVMMDRVITILHCTFIIDHAVSSIHITTKILRSWAAHKGFGQLLSLFWRLFSVEGVKQSFRRGTSAGHIQYLTYDRLSTQYIQICCVIQIVSLHRTVNQNLN